ncbi:MAG: hypothetical protein K1X28_03930 [Parachlamydiales bacterium]|nr:hypothetical protein [Parachlamydiales bacterium]
MKILSLHLLRYSMSIIYFWFGALKIMGISPAEELVFRATHWTGVHNFVFFLGIWEVAIGLFLFIRKLYWLGLTLLFLQFPGTFSPLFLNPEDCFTVFPYGLTIEGQYIMKNLILICAGIVLASHLRKPCTKRND